MNPRIPWAERTFTFDFAVDNYAEVLERLRGTPLRAAALVRGCAAETLSRRDGEHWSIQENIGHLADLDDLVHTRIDEYQASATTLSPADMTNRQTWEAGHNERPMRTILESLQKKRDDILNCLEGLPAQSFGRTCLHPRLNQPMRLVDLLCFTAQHDDYHLARVRQLVRKFEPNSRTDR